MNLLKSPWNIVFLVGFILYAGIRHRFEQRTKGTETILSRIDGLEKALIGVLAVGIFLLPIFYLFTPLLASADYHPPAFAPWCGTAIMVASLWLFWHSHADLGVNWSFSLEMRKNHQLIRNGVYRLVRHPMYASVWLWGVAQALLLPNWVAGPSALIAFAPLYFLRTPREEAMMREAFGDEYVEYMRKTGRLFPRLNEQYRK